MAGGRISFNYNSIMADMVGKHGVGQAQIQAWMTRAKASQAAIKKMAVKPSPSQELKTYHWTQLPFQKLDQLNRVALGLLDNDIENVASLGIGGSFLGNQTLHEALNLPYWNEFIQLRKGYPRMYFQGMNLDAVPVKVLADYLDPARTALVVISKSGTTTETAVAFATFKGWMETALSQLSQIYEEQIVAVTDGNPGTGVLRQWVEKVNKDAGKEVVLSLPVPDGVGGRFSVLSPVGLITAALTGIDCQQLLDGTADMYKRTVENEEIMTNPALMYALLHSIAYKELSKNIAVMMPFSEQLKSFGEWYVQLLAESLGKQHDRDGNEVFSGRTPIPSIGNRNLHADQQNNVEGEFNKVITFIGIDKSAVDFTIKESPSPFLVGKTWSETYKAALTAARADMTNRSRPNCLITLPELNPYTLGQLIFMMEMATAYEGELLNINTYNQPGVDGYKRRMYGILGREGFEGDAVEVVQFLTSQKPEYII